MGQFEYAAAAEILEGLASRAEGDVGVRVDLAIAILNRQEEGDEDRALALVQGVLADAPGYLRALYVAGLLELHEGKVQQAVERFRKVVEADPEDAHAQYYLGQALDATGAHDEALGWYRRVIAVDPYLRSAWYGAFQLLRRLGHDDEAREMLKGYQTLEANPRARLAEYKYTRMGPKAEVRPRCVVSDEVKAPAGALFLPPRTLASLAGAPTSLTAADIDGDGRLDLLVAGLGGDRPNRVFLASEGGGVVEAKDLPFLGATDVRAALWGDIDNDGRTDLYLCRRGVNQLWRRTERGWEEIAVAAGVGGGDLDTRDGLLFDADHDGDLDIFLAQGDGPNELFSNNLDGTFRPLGQERGIGGAGEGARQVLALDLDRDRDLDILVLNDAHPHEVWLNDRLWAYHPAEGFGAFNSTPLVAAVAEDRDVDGRPELIALGTDGAVTRWSRVTSGEWQPEGLVPAAKGRTGLGLADVDGDGLNELVAGGRAGIEVFRLGAGRSERIAQLRKTAGPWLLLNSQPGRGPALVTADGEELSIQEPGPGRHPFAAVVLSGNADPGQGMRSNASGIGTRLAARIGDRWVVPPIMRASSLPGQGEQPTEIGLTGAQKIDYLELEWSDGVFQTELDLAAGKLHRITETQRQLSSCPVLFTWDGERFRFVTDLLGVGGIGFAVGPGEYAPSRPWENLLLPQDALRPRDGRYLLRLGEPMEEAMYLDAARLVAYDLPPGWSMVPDERMGIQGPEPTGQPLFYRREALPKRALDSSGADVTASVVARDGIAAPVGALDHRFIGRLRGAHAVTLEFDAPLDPAGAVLLMDGWIEYPYSQTMFAAWQAGASYEAPSLDVEVHGEWRTLLSQFGYPAGMPRRAAMPLHDLPEGVTRLRLRTNQEVYWDRLSVVWAEELPQARRQELPLVAASVAEAGFPLRTTGPQRRPHYDYGHRLPLWDTRYMAGWYTEYGDAEALVAAVDDATAIVGPGEEVRLEFAADLADPEAGWTRALVLEANGWAKDMDLYTLDGDTLEPLPSRGAQADPRRDVLHARYNTRYRSGL